MKENIAKVIIIGAIFVGVVFYAASYFVEEREKDIVAGITFEITEQQQVLSNIARLTDQDGIDAVGAAIIEDCKPTDRNTFDQLLSNLGNLNEAQLAEVDNLFDKCADFYAKRKAMMVARMEREYEAYSDLVNLLSIVDDAPSVEAFAVTDWGRLLEYEQRRGELYAEQVVIQREIIEALIAGERPGSDVLQELTLEARNVAEELIVVDKQSDALHTQLMAL